MDILPIAGPAIHLQHQLIGNRKVNLNPIRHLLETDGLNNDLFSSELPHEASSKMMVRNYFIIITHMLFEIE